MLNRNIAEIKPNPNNPRIIKDDKFKKLMQSMIVDRMKKLDPTLIIKKNRNAI